VFPFINEKACSHAYMLPNSPANFLLTYVTPEPRYLNNEPTSFIKGKKFFAQTCQEMCFTKLVSQ
jgi:hypothetical protein